MAENGLQYNAGSNPWWSSTTGVTPQSQFNYSYRRAYTGQVQAVVVDFNGTIIDEGSYAVSTALMNAFESKGAAISADESRICAEGSDVNMYDKVVRKADIRAILNAIAGRWKAASGKDPTDWDVEGIYKEYCQFYKDSIGNFATPVNHAVAVVNHLKENHVKVATVTDLSADTNAALLEEARKAGMTFDTSVTADDVSTTAPWPWAAQKATQNLSIFPQACTVMVSAEPSQIEAGLNAGMWTVGVRKTGLSVGLQDSLNAEVNKDTQHKVRRSSERLQRAGAHFVVDGIWNLPKVLEDINSLLAHGQKP